MTIIRSLRLLTLAFLATALSHVADAQVASTLRLSKKQYLAGEPVLAVITITNHAGQPLTFASDGRNQWLDIIIKDRKGDSVSPKRDRSFGKMTVKAGETMAREVDLAEHFQLSEPGNFSAVAVIHVPGVGDGSTTNRVLFDQTPGSPYWKQKVGVAGRPGQIREFRVLNFSSDDKSQIYAQIIDVNTAQNVRTFPLGDALMLRKPLVTVDGRQRMHVMFLATPTMWVHCEVDTDGKMTNRQIHQRGPQGDPQLLTYADGSVRVSNSIPYDAKAAAEAKAKVRKASDRPAGTY
ncbi:hypothetical protein JIN84_14520 [Luteolibacter yonseiensis]|uniref:Uncharacterized protein n=1 Tax=Luteolibacter yonseiensis TaxID=1144680 RepID=A0A934R484_9BACT|nr:hypothetical protein [Luteolibacter yonseiensis]MBK1816836.1 hypothetical protein [Luteolibacter yonseiensis]